MCRVYRGLLHAVAWAVTTAAAVTLAWFGVHSVLRSTAYDLPRAMPIATTAPPEISDATSQPPPPSPTHAHRPATTPPPSPRTSSTTPPPPPVPPKTPPGTPHPTPSATGPTGNVHSYTLNGGRVVLDLGPASASLVTATPAGDWKMQVWTQDGWLRVTFTSADGTASSSLFCTWNGHPPTVESYEN
ncbi:hypothetical protein OG552_12515 [Streptomyces sp. NBC_01476]|uniref:hypothetical protein n=1 Tax=Streptomyces sp. NBC_01476 TaxID=2903881 RepID=UPI002E370D18|nr:hypothetical protein [Streptomyces sp. NBC_01476]